MSLENLLAGKSAQFFRPNLKRKLTPTSLRNIVADISRVKTGQFEDYRIREVHHIDGLKVHTTYACFKFKSEPSFLKGSDLRDLKHAYLLIVECPDGIAVISRNISGIGEALEPFVSSWSYEQLGGAFVDRTTAYERIELSGMSTGGNVVRRRSLEADDLAVSMAIAGIHRSIPRNFRARSGSGTHTITPRNSRISRKAPRAELLDIIRWVNETAKELEHSSSKYGESFLAQFCRAWPLVDLPKEVVPAAVSFDFSQLRTEWEESPGSIEFVVTDTSSSTEHLLNERNIHDLFILMDRTFSVEAGAIAYTSAAGKTRNIGQVRINKNSISVRGDFFDRIRIRRTGGEVRLGTYVTNEGTYLITFTNPEFGYAERQLFRDSQLLGSIDTLLKLFEPRNELIHVTDEKAVGAREFGSEGIFRFVEESLFTAEATLLCDDLGDEWADYVALETATPMKKLSFVHCKHGETTSSASSLQVPIGQAVKNLSRMFRPLGEFSRKVDQKWTTTYNGRIPRIRRGGTASDIKGKFSEVISAPNTQRDVVLVLSGVSRQTMQNEFDSLRVGVARPHVSQLLWLLANFYSACQEHGVGVRIVCQP